jgi:hypothetical protein
MSLQHTEAQEIDRFRAVPAVLARVSLREPTKFDQLGRQYWRSNIALAGRLSVHKAPTRGLFCSLEWLESSVFRPSEPSR